MIDSIRINNATADFFDGLTNMLTNNVKGSAMVANSSKAFSPETLSALHRRQ